MSEIEPETEESTASVEAPARGWTSLRTRLTAAISTATSTATSMASSKATSTTTRVTTIGWIGPLLVTGLGAWLRFADLSTPQNVVFDETYYAPQAYGILNFGAEHTVGVFTDNQIVGGDTSGIFVYGGLFAAHPPFGKVQIAAGEWLFGLNPFGWRFSVALAGSLSILMIARIARRLTGSTLLGCIAGLLLALDGLELVMSRIAMLDIFVMFWVLAAFGCLVIDRDVGRTRAGPRWWRLGAGVCLGFAAACKWNGLYFLIGFTVLAAAWSVAAHRADHTAADSTSKPRLTTATLRAGSAAVADLWQPAALAYLATWSGWFASSIGWDRNYAAQHGVRIPVVSALYSLAEYHREMFDYNTTLTAPNTFQSQPWTWLLLTHPVRFFYAAPRFAESGCQVPSGCVQNVLAVGTPAIWWASIPALLVLLVWWLRRRDWRAGAVLTGVAAGWLLWFVFPSRTQFSYYAVSLVPFLVLALTLCIGLLLGPPSAQRPQRQQRRQRWRQWQQRPRWRRLTGATLTAAYLAAVSLNLAYLYPVLTGQPISRAAWLARMLFSAWI